MTGLLVFASFLIASDDGRFAVALDKLDSLVQREVVRVSVFEVEVERLELALKGWRFEVVVNVGLKVLEFRVGDETTMAETAYG